MTKVAASGISLGAVLLTLLVAWLTWNYTLSRVDRVFILSMLGFGSFGSQ